VPSSNQFIPGNLQGIDLLYGLCLKKKFLPQTMHLLFPATGAAETGQHNITVLGGHL
jgi:hypothetical protein